MEVKNSLEIKKIYDEATLLFQNRQSVKATELFELVISFGESPYLSGAYTTLANIILHEDPSNLESIKKSKSCVEKALVIKPTNQVAKSTLVNILILEENFSSAINNFLQLTIHKLIKDSLSSIEHLESYAAMGDKAIQEAIPEIEKLYQKYKTVSPKIGSTMAYSYFSVKDYHKAYNVYKELIEIYKNEDLISISFQVGLSLVCSSGLNKAKEGIDAALNGIQLFNKQKHTFQEENDYLIENLNSNLALGYLRREEFGKVISILPEKIRRNPNNTDLHNLAYAYYKTGEYENALKYCTQALYIVTDETSLFIKGEILYLKGHFFEALTFYKKALGFIKADSAYFAFTDGNGEVLTSSILDYTETLKKTHLGIINCYINLKEFELAKAVLQLALKEFPYEDNFVRFDHIISTFKEYKVAEKEVQNKISYLQQELELQKEAYLKEMNEVREWAEDLLKIQGRYTKGEDLLIKTEADWGAISKQLHKIALKAKEEQNNPAQFERIKSDFNAKYPKLSREGLEFLSTGEYLYQVHRDKDIDFAPFVVEFSRVIETELNILLKKRKVINKGNNFTLGQMYNHFHKIKLKNLANINDFLKELIGYRNSCAHTGKSTREEAEKVRNMLLNEGWLNLILDV